MAPRRRAGRNASGVNRQFLNQRQKLNLQRLPVYQGPSPAPVQGPSLTPQPSGLMGTRTPPTTVRPAPGPNIWEMGRRAATTRQAPTVAAMANRSLLSTLGVPAILGGLLGVGSSMLFPAPAGKGSTLEGTDMDPKKLAEESNKRIAAAKAAEEAKTPVKQQLSAAAISFDRAFAKARAEGKDIFTWRGKRYTTELA